jgi:hypothetical protein
MSGIAEPIVVGAPGGISFQLERFAWTAGKLEVTGRWHGVRGRRFMRPTLTCHQERDQRRMLASLGHKTRPPRDGEPWFAAFPCSQPPDPKVTYELALSPSVKVALPSPQVAPQGGGERPPAPVAELPADPPLTQVLAARGGAHPAPPRAGDAVTAALDSAQAHLSELMHERDEALAALAVTTRVRDALARELDGLRASADAHRRERDDAVAARLEAERARESAVAARDAASTAAEALRRDGNAAVARIDRLRSERDAILAKLDVAEQDRQRLRSALVEVTGERDRGLRERDRAVLDREVAQRDRDAAEVQLNVAERKLERVVRERDALRGQIEAAAEEPHLSVERPAAVRQVPPNGHRHAPANGHRHPPGNGQRHAPGNGHRLEPVETSHPLLWHAAWAPRLVALVSLAAALILLFVLVL